MRTAVLLSTIAAAIAALQGQVGAETVVQGQAQLQSFPGFAGRMQGQPFVSGMQMPMRMGQQRFQMTGQSGVQAGLQGGMQIRGRGASSMSFAQTCPELASCGEPSSDANDVKAFADCVAAKNVQSLSKKCKKKLRPILNPARAKLGVPQDTEGVQPPSARGSGRVQGGFRLGSNQMRGGMQGRGRMSVAQACPELAVCGSVGSDSASIKAFADCVAGSGVQSLSNKCKKALKPILDPARSQMGVPQEIDEETREQIIQGRGRARGGVRAQGGLRLGAGQQRFYGQGQGQGQIRYQPSQQVVFG